MDDASPPKWHLAHTTWFFETFLLKEQGHEAFHPQYEYLFNSYYNGVGNPYPRPKRGFLSRPTVDEVLAYRRHVDERVVACLQTVDCAEIVELGINHEQQHQELLLTDLKYNFGNNPLAPVYQGQASRLETPSEVQFVEFEGGLANIGVAADGERFKFDNECPRHQVLLHPFQFANRLVSNRDYLEFVQDGGYQTSSLWLSEGWQIVQERGWRSPLYWQEHDGEWYEYRFDGLHPIDLDLPVVHVSGHEAYAYAVWAEARLPTEFEWESVALTHTPSHAQNSDQQAWVESQRYHPGGYSSTDDIQQLFGYVWQWTASSYSPYPGFKPLPGTLGEYNGKFMSSQWVLRGGSCATPESHHRVSYRNFFYPPDRWQFSGLRLARDV